VNSEIRAAGSGGNDLVDLRVVLDLLWRAKFVIIAITSFFAVLSVVVALVLPNQYRASVYVVPTESTSMSSLGQLASQFGGLASIAGINLGGDSGSDKSVIAMELVKTWDFLDHFIKDNGLEVAVFAAEGWNRATDQLVIDDDLYDISTGEWVRNFNPSKGETAHPSSWELYEELRDRITVRQDASTGIITLSVEFYSPKIAKDWVDMLVVAINTRLRIRDRDDASKSIEYLRQQIEQTSLAEMRNVFYQLVEEQTKNLMLTEVSDEYVLSTLSPARVPEENSWPNRALICIGGTLAGFILALMFVLLRNAFGSIRQEPEVRAD